MPVNISGVEPTLKAMRKFDGVLYKEMNKEIKTAMITIRDKARGDVPIPYPSYLYGWEKGNKPTCFALFSSRAHNPQSPRRYQRVLLLCRL